MKHDSKFALSVIAGVFLSALNGCSSTYELTSSWNRNSIVVDGKDADWGAPLRTLTTPPVTVGVRNDGEFLYVCLLTTDRFLQMQILGGGLTVWIDPRGEQNETFGIRYPLHDENSPLMNPREPLAASFQYIEPTFRELEFLGPNDEHEIVSTLESGGLRIKMGAEENTLVYELQVPLRSGPQFRHAAHIDSSLVIGVGFQTEEFGSDRLQGPSGRATAGSRGGGRGRGRRSAGGGGATIGGADRPEPLNLWTKVTLTAQP